MANEMPIKWRLGEILLQKGWITWATLHQALQIQEQTGASLGFILDKHLLVPSTRLYRAVAIQEGLAFVDLRHFTPEISIFNMLPRELAAEMCILPIKTKDRRVTIAIHRELSDADKARVLTHMEGLEVFFVMAEPQAIKKSIETYYNYGLNAA